MTDVLQRIRKDAAMLEKFFEGSCVSQCLECGMDPVFLREIETLVVSLTRERDTEHMLAKDHKATCDDLQAKLKRLRKHAKQVTNDCNEVQREIERLRKRLVIVEQIARNDTSKSATHIAFQCRAALEEKP